MGLIYSSADSLQLINALGTNIKTANKTTSQLTKGSQQVIGALSGKKLSGAAYTAGKGLFSELVIPTISRVTSSFSQLEQELKTYQSADSAISGEGYLDEDNLLRQISIKETQKNSALSSISVLLNQIQLATSPEMSASIINVQRELKSLADSLSADIRTLEKKIEKIHTFSSETSGLFINSLSDLQNAMQAVTILNKTAVMNDGTYLLPKGIAKKIFAPGSDIGDIDLTEKQNKEIAKKTDGLPYHEKIKVIVAWFEANVFPISQDIAMDLLEEHGSEWSMALYNAVPKVSNANVGTPVAGTIYASSKVIGSASKAMPIIGTVIDYGSMVTNGESAHDALAKTGAHVFTGIGIGLAVTAVGLTGGGAFVVGVLTAWAVNEWLIDPLYDFGKKAVGNAIKSVKSWVGNLFV